jgi:ribosome modulation factor
MPSTVTYYRPGGVSGIYAVQVTLELQPSQWAKVAIGRYRDRGYHCGSCGHQHPINPLQTETQRIEQYAEFRDIWERDTITIEIHERALGEEGPYQIVVYTASRSGIQAKSLPCTRHGRTWHQNELKFHEIALIDAGVSPSASLTHLIEERVRKEDAENRERVVSTQSESGVYHVQNGFTVRGLLALPIARQKREQQMLLPRHRREAVEQVARLN